MIDSAEQNSFSSKILEQIVKKICYFKEFS